MFRRSVILDEFDEFDQRPYCRICKNSGVTREGYCCNAGDAAAAWDEERARLRRDHDEDEQRAAVQN
jgi:hypothetical protein